MPAPACDDPEPGQPTVRPLPPRTPYEDAVVGILGEVLGCSGISVHDRLLALGGLPEVPRVVAQIRKTMGVELPVADYVESRTVAGLAAVVAARSLAARATPQPQALAPRSPDARPVLSYDQQRLWMENQLLPGSIYNVHGRRRIIGALDVAVVEASIRTIIARHETLRTRFPAVDGELMQVVDEPVDDWHIRIGDLTGNAGPDRPEAAARAVQRLLDTELTTPFDLAAGPLIRCLLIKVSDREHILSVTMHHIVSDAWSIGLFVRELTALYRAGGDPGRAGLGPLPVQYRDYAVWQRDWLTGEVLESRISYWREHLKAAPRALALPTVQRRTNALRAEAGQVLSELPPDETAALHELCREHGVTSFMVLYAVLATIFSRWSGQPDIVIGVPVAGRNNAGTDRLIGFFVNMLPVRIDLSGNPSFASLLENVRQVAVGAYAHAEAPMDELVRDLDVVRDPRRTPLFEVVLNVVASPEAEEISDLAIEPMDTPSLFSRYDLTFTAQESGGVLRFKLDFPADRCDLATGRVLLAQLRSLLRIAVADPAVRLLDEPLDEPPGEPGPAPVSPAPHLSLARHAAEPGPVAAEDGEGRWSYAWMSGAVGNVAEELARRGVTSEDRVGVVRRPLAAFLATLAGAAQAGLTPTVIETDDPALTGPLGLTAVLDPRPAGPPAAGTIDLTPILPGRDRAGAGTPATPATGPDDWTVGRLGFGRQDRFVVLSSRPGLLASALGSAFAAGATLVIPDQAFGDDTATVTDWLRDRSVTVAYLDPPILRAMAAHPAASGLPGLRCLVIDNAGDLLPHDIVAARELAPGSRCVGVYRVAADGRPLAWYEAPPGLDVENAPLRVPLGKPLTDRPVTLRRPSGPLAATGELAEIWAGPDRTGDLGRWWPDGSIEYAAEPGTSAVTDPIATVSALRDAPGVRDAIVVRQAAADGRATLLGYVAGPDPEAGPMALLSHVKARLPDYLVPEHLVVLDALPRTPWGGYDLRALPRPAGDAGDGGNYAAPRTHMERQLTAILADLLGLEQVGIYDSFFELGGFSMLATRLLIQVREVFGVQLAVRDVFESPTVDELSQLVVRAQLEQSGLDDFEALLAEVEQA